MIVPRRHFLAVTFAIVVSVAVLPFTALPSRAAETLPAQISDEAFWRMISEFSEDDGYFRFENFLSNELAFQNVIPDLKDIIKPGGVYLGVGPEQNFTYIVALHPKISFIVDIRRQNMLEHLMYKALFEMSPDRAEFLSKLFSRRRPANLKGDATPEELFTAFQPVERDPQYYKQNFRALKDVLVKEHKYGLSKQDIDKIEYIYSIFSGAGPYLDYSVGGFGSIGSPTYAELMTATDDQGLNRGFLANDENFQSIREIEAKNMIVPLVGDFAGPKAVRRLGQYLKDHEATVAVFYTSNVEQYLFQQENDWNRFYASVATLPMDSSSTFIRSISGASFPRGNGYRFQSVISSMPDLIKSFEEGRLKTYYDLIDISR